MQLESTLDQFPLSELLAMIAASSVTGVLDIGATSPVGRIFSRDGRVYHAEAGEQIGLDAIRAILAAAGAPFSFVAGVYSASESLNLEPWALVAQVERDRRLLARMRRHIPSFDWVPELWAGDAAGVRLSVEIWPVLAAVDGRRSVAEIAASIGQDALEAGAIVSELIERDLVRLAPPAPPAPVASAPSGSFFDRVLTGQLNTRSRARRTPASKGALALRWLTY